jgi:hypothetical protein
VANSIGSGYHWGTAPYMRQARATSSSPITAALASPHTVLWSFVRLRGDSVWDLRERRMQEARAEIAGAIDGAYDYGVDPKWHPALCNTPWHDRTRDVTFLQHGLRPVFPEDYDRQVESYFRGEKGGEFRYERMPWGTQFVQMEGKTPRLIYGVASCVQAAPVAGAGIPGWVVYNNAAPTHTWNRTAPSGLPPARFYVLDPSIRRPPVYVSTTQGYGPSFYESYVEDSGYNDTFIFLRLRTIERLSKVSGWENLAIHSPAPPKAVYVNGKLTPAARQGETDVYTLSVQPPADIVVFVKDPPREPANLSQAALLRVTEVGAPVDYYRPEVLQAQANGGKDEKGLPVLQDAVVSSFGFNFGGRKHLYVPASAARPGTLRLHLPAKDNKDLETVAVNLVPLARAEGAVRIPESLDLPLSTNDTKLISFHSRASAPQDHVTMRVAVEWLETP